MFINVLFVSIILGVSEEDRQRQKDLTYFDTEMALFLVQIHFKVHMHADTYIT